MDEYRIMFVKTLFSLSQEAVPEGLIEQLESLKKNVNTDIRTLCTGIRNHILSRYVPVYKYVSAWYVGLQRI